MISDTEYGQGKTKYIQRLKIKKKTAQIIDTHKRERDMTNVK